jgi:hypothetical protein
MEISTVRYCDSYIYIGLRETDEKKNVLNDVRNVYIWYTVSINQQIVDETVLLKKKDIILGKDEFLLKFGLEIIIQPENAEISISTIKVNLTDGKSRILELKKIYSLVEIRVSRRFLDELLGKKPKSDIGIKNALFVDPKTIIQAKKEIKKKLIPSVQESIVKKVNLRLLESKEKSPEECQLSISSMLSRVESKVNERLETHINKLNLDINRLSFASIDLILTCLPKPYSRSEFKHSKAVIDSIHKYINLDLIQGGEDH